MNRIFLRLTIGSMFLFSSASYAAITEGIISDFQSGDPGGWAHGDSSSPNPPIVKADDGPTGAGDFALWVEANGIEPAVEGTSSPGSELVAFNRSTAPQDAINAFSLGTTGKMVMDLKHVSGHDYKIRFAVGNAKLGKGGTWYVSKTPHTLSEVNSGNWEHAEFDFSDLVKFQASDAPGEASLEEVLGGIFEVRILHNADLAAKGHRVKGIFAVDNIAAVPLPAAFWLFLSAVGGLIGFTRRR